MVEIWKDVIGYEGWYQVSNYGSVKSVDRFIVYSNKSKRFQKGKILKPTLKNNGYYYVSLTKNQKSFKFDVHRLVAENFLANENNFPCVNHIDGVKTNNNVNNLEWCSYSYNSIHSDCMGLSKRTYGELNGMSKLTSVKVIEIKKLLSDGVTGSEISKMFGISKSTISMIKNKKLWPHI